MSPKRTIARTQMEQEITHTFKISKKMNIPEFGIVFDEEKVIHHIDESSNAINILKKKDTIVAINGVKCNTYLDVKILAKYTTDCAIFAISRSLCV